MAQNKIVLTSVFEAKTCRRDENWNELIFNGIGMPSNLKEDYYENKMLRCTRKRKRTQSRV